MRVVMNELMRKTVFALIGIYSVLVPLSSANCDTLYSLPAMNERPITAIHFGSAPDMDAKHVRVIVSDRHGVWDVEMADIQVPPGAPPNTKPFRTNVSVEYSSETNEKLIYIRDLICASDHDSSLVDSCEISIKISQDGRKFDNKSDMICTLIYVPVNDHLNNFFDFLEIECPKSIYLK